MAKKGKKKFLRQTARAYRRLGRKWRKPRGSQSKMRRKERGKAKMPSIGYGRPKHMRGLHPSGLREVLVHNLKQLEKIDAKSEAIKIASKVGKKKRAEIVKGAKELKVKILNP